MGNRFGDLVRDYRIRVGWSQRELAERAGLDSHSFVSRLESPQATSSDSRGRGVSWAVAQAIIKALDKQYHFSRGQLQELAAAYLIPESWQSESWRAQPLTIGLILPSIHLSSFWSKIASSIQGNLLDLGYTTAICQHEEDINQELEQLAFFRNATGLAGMIIAPAVGIPPFPKYRHLEVADILTDLQRQGTPIVSIDRRFKERTNVSIPYVGFDNVAASYIAVKRLIREGHTRIGAILSLSQSPTQRDRFIGYRKAINDSKLLYNESLVKFGEEVPRSQRELQRRMHGIRRGRTNAKELLSLPVAQRPTAIFCGASYVAIEVVAAIREIARAGTSFAAPQHLSLIGFDDVPELDTPIAQITRVIYPTAEISKIAVNKLTSLIENSEDKIARQDEVIRTLEIVEKGPTARL